MPDDRKPPVRRLLLAGLCAGGALFVSGLAACNAAKPPPAPIDRPADAIVLFDGANLDEWAAPDGSPAGWTLADGVMTVNKGAGDIATKRRFGDYQLHIEWRIPADITGSGEQRGNSGVFLAWTGSDAGGYELQILDSYGNPSDPKGQAGAFYGKRAPLANVSRKPGAWQTYDVTWRAPAFTRDGRLLTPARATVRYNGVVVQDNVAVETSEPRAYQTAPIKLQAHNDPSPPISFRNIWIRELP